MQKKNTTWVFNGKGGRNVKLPATRYCEELDSTTTFYLFDAKASAMKPEPDATDAKLLLFTSPNLNSYKQIKRGGRYPHVWLPELDSGGAADHAKRRPPNIFDYPSL